MAKPRIFISSTFFDLRTLRDDLDRFVRSQGYEPVRHERGQIPYGAEEKPEQYAYREIDMCDMLVCIIGSRYGTASAYGNYSITQKELKTALDNGRQVYIFVEDAVYHEHKYYLANRAVSGVKFPAVDDVKVHGFLEEIYSLSKGNPIFPFSTASDIASMLQEQWAGLFQRLLQENASRQQSSLIDGLQQSLSTVDKLVKFLTEQNNDSKAAIGEIIFESHPLFSGLREALASKYRLYFRSLAELSDWLLHARGYSRVDDDDFVESEDYYEWMKRVNLTGRGGRQRTYILMIHKCLFSQDGKLKPMQQSDWSDEYINLKSLESKAAVTSAVEADDEL